MRKLKINLNVKKENVLKHKVVYLERKIIIKYIIIL